MRRLLLKSVDVVVTTVLSEEDCVFALNEGQRTALDAFHGGKYVLALVPTRFSKRRVKSLQNINKCCPSVTSSAKWTKQECGNVGNSATEQLYSVRCHWQWVFCYDNSEMFRCSSGRQGVHMQVCSSLFGAIHRKIWPSALARLFTQFSEKFRVKHCVFFSTPIVITASRLFFFLVGWSKQIIFMIRS